MVQIITISREFGSGGRTIGKEVAEKLGIPCYDKYFTEQEWGKRQNYHLSIDSGFLGIEKPVVGLVLHLKANKEIKNTLAYIKPSGRIIKGIYSIGFAAIIAQALMSVMTYLLNVIFVRIGENVVTAYGLYYKIQQFILFSAFGLRDAITPIVSFNHGMGSKERVKDGIKYGLIYTLGIMLIGFVGLEVFAEPFAGVFGLSGETKQLCVSAMRVISVSYMFAGANIAFQGIFQALDSGLESLIISVCRQFLFVIPVAYLFAELVISGTCGTWLVWMSFVIAEVLSVIVSVVFMKKVNTKKVMSMN